MKTNNIHNLLTQFQLLWNKSLDGDYSHHAELNSLAKAIKAIKCDDSLYPMNLTTTELITISHALIIANLWSNKGG